MLTWSPVIGTVKHDVLPAGPAFLNFARRAVHSRSFEEDDSIEADHYRSVGASKATSEVDPDEDVPSEPESNSLLNSDPKEWKQQDHYAVLGLSELRWQATPGQIKAAHRKKVLKHHPDKKASQTSDSNDDSFFKCIAKAYDVLSNPVKRRQYDSVDPRIDDEDFPRKAVKPEKFFEAWGPVFAREVRFASSGRDKAPTLGDMESTKPQVEAFYDYWYSFDSYRSFEYDDKEANEGSDRFVRLPHQSFNRAHVRRVFDQPRRETLSRAQEQSRTRTQEEGRHCSPPSHRRHRSLFRPSHQKIQARRESSS